MKVLVTGGSGFVGSHVIDRLRARGALVRNYDRRKSSHHASRSLDTVLGDLNDVETLTSALHGIGTVVHVAAIADVNDVVKDLPGADEGNVRGTLNVLEAARMAGVQRIVYTSTIWVYSNSPGALVDEETPLGLPDHFYTATKLAGEMYVRSFCELHGIEYTILRLGIPYGPRARSGAVVPIFVRKALAGEPLTIAGGGTQSRRFVFVEDLADGIARAVEPQAADRVYNLVGDEDVTILQIAEIVRDLVGDVTIDHVDGRAADFAGAVGGGARARDELGWTASTPFSDGVARYLEWYLQEHPSLVSMPSSAPVEVAAVPRRAAES